MKKLFGTLLAILIVASIFTYRTLPGAIKDKPVLYWVTDSNPARTEQVRTFKKWLQRVYPEAPDVELLVDTANMASEKVLIQGVSGVCADLVDHTGGAPMRFRHSVGMLEDVTDDALEMGFDTSQTYPAIRAELVDPVKIVDEDGTVRFEERQFAFPCNVTATMFWVNKEAFEKIELEIPPKRWTVDDFERIGKEFVTRSNPPNELQRIFFVADIQPRLFARSNGGSIFNETCTKPTTNNEPMIEAMRLRYKWTYETPRLIPTASERDDFAASSGYGGAGLAMFGQGNYALVSGGRYLLIQFRKITEERIAGGLGPMKLAVSEFPYWKMPIASTSTRATAVYAGGKNKELALYFMAYLASEDYNMNIVLDADALPPNPKYTELEEFKRPKDYPEEWGCHEPFSEAMQTIAVPMESSPFVIDQVVDRLINKAQDYYMNDLKTVEKALTDLDADITFEIERSLEENPELQEMYDERLRTQAKIDELRAKGEKVPISWIDNVFLKRWYEFNGWADMDR